MTIMMDIDDEKMRAVVRISCFHSKCAFDVLNYLRIMLTLLIRCMRW